jgi:hypothetical protein
LILTEPFLLRWSDQAMPTTGNEFQLEVDRGPNWLFVTVRPTTGSCDLDSLTDELWAVVAKHFIYRLVVELDAVGDLSSSVVAQLIELRDRLEANGGALRVCGLSAPSIDALAHYKLPGTLYNHPSRVSAVLANDSSHRLAAMHFDATVPSVPKTTLVANTPHAGDREMATVPH